MVRSLVHEPDYVIVLDPLLRNTIDVTDGLKPNGGIVINSDYRPEDIEFSKQYRVATVDATKVALETIGIPITNTAILGAFAKASEEVRLESLLDAVKREMSGRMAESNCRAVELAYNRTLVGVNKINPNIAKPSGVTSSRADLRTFRPEVDSTKCTGCQICWTFCPEHCIDMVEKKSVINYNYCKGCGICAE